jgi:hypothetical protein
VIEREVIRFEPLAVLVPLGHPFANAESVRIEALAGVEIDANPGSPDAPEWSDLVSQFLALTGAEPTPDHVPAVGLDDQAYHLVQQGLPILTTVDHVTVPGGVLVPIVEPVPIYRWSMAWRPGSHPAGLAAIRQAATMLGRGQGWLELPEHAWLPEPEASAPRRRSGTDRSPRS